MKFTVLGRYGPFPAPGGCCSGYLLESGNMALAIDMGNGTLSRLLQLKPNLNINAVLLSHLHSDHMGDMYILRYALQQLKARGRDVPMPLTVLTPEAPEQEYKELAASGVYDMIRIYDGMRARFGEVSITFHRMIHPVPTFAFEIEREGKRLVYTGDTGMHPKLYEICKNAEILLADTGFLSEDKSTEIAPHMTAREVGELARKAGVKQLICTHLWGGGYTEEQILHEVKEFYPTALIAQEMHTYEV